MDDFIAANGVQITITVHPDYADHIQSENAECWQNAYGDTFPDEGYWAIVDSNGFVIQRVNNEYAGNELLMTDEYPCDVEVAFIN